MPKLSPTLGFQRRSWNGEREEDGQRHATSKRTKVKISLQRQVSLIQTQYTEAQRVHNDMNAKRKQACALRPEKCPSTAAIYTFGSSVTTVGPSAAAVSPDLAFFTTFTLKSVLLRLYTSSRHAAATHTCVIEKRGPVT